MIEFLAGLLAGAGGCGVLALWAFRRFRRPVHADYRERWLQAVDLLGEEGRLTAEQVASLKGSAPARAVAASAPAAPARAPVATPAVLRSMASWDRRDLEIARAKRGLPPLDDLGGMASWDKEAVIKARIKHEAASGG